jgi:uncharacterized membrane protein YeaQ/YmgE (transglycosylase-associated protein family)
MSVFNSNLLGALISNQQENAAFTFAAWIGIGLATGLVGSKILNKRDYRQTRYILLSIFGAIVGGFLSNLLGRPEVSSLDFYSLLVSFVGAVVFLIVYHALFRRRHFLNMS